MQEFVAKPKRKSKLSVKWARVADLVKFQSVTMKPVEAVKGLVDNFYVILCCTVIL